MRQRTELLREISQQHSPTNLVARWMLLGMIVVCMALILPVCSDQTEQTRPDAESLTTTSRSTNSTSATINPSTPAMPRANIFSPTMYRALFGKPTILIPSTKKKRPTMYRSTSSTPTIPLLRISTKTPTSRWTKKTSPTMRYRRTSSTPTRYSRSSRGISSLSTKYRSSTRTIRWTSPTPTTHPWKSSTSSIYEGSSSTTTQDQFTAANITDSSSIWFNGECGRSKYPNAGNYFLPDARIVGGIAAREHEFPWQASLREKTTNRHFCGGVIINRRWILTAAHCSVTYTAPYVSVVIGEHRITLSNPVRRSIGVQKVIRHPGYNSATHENDIALWKLAEYITLSQNVWPVCPPDPHKVYVNRKCQCSGWGSLYPGGSTSNKLMYTTVNITTNVYCQLEYPLESITNNMVCATDNTGNTARDSCQGDSGGPLTVKNPGGKFSVVGIVSWGYGCASGYPGVYARTTYFVDWITRTISNI